MAIDIEAPGANEADLQRALSNLKEYRGCRLERSTNWASQNITSETAIPFEAAVTDSDSFYSAGSPTRATIGTGKGFTVVNAAAHVRFQGGTADTWMKLTLYHRNSAGTGLRLSSSTIEVGQANPCLSVAMMGVPVSDGDFFDARVQTESDTTHDAVANGTALSVEVVGMNPV